MSLDTKAMRRLVLRHSKRANVGHIGSNLCVVEILAALFGGAMRISSPDDPDRDRFVLSKGHAALALYTALVLKGWLPEEALDRFCGDDTLLGIHPERALTGIDFCAGSLGHGMSFAAGAALAARMQKSARRVFCLISDAECNEGSVWETAMFAGHHRLGNLRVVIDLNGQQALGLTRDISDSSNMAQRWEAFGWQASSVDGHSLEELTEVLAQPDCAEGAPRVVLARTVMGRGVPFMEQGISVSRPQLAVQPVNWHYLPMTDLEYDLALAAVEESE